MARVPRAVALHWLLRLAVCMEFVGHGAFGILTKMAWIPYIQFFGFSEHSAWLIMPVVGCLDVFLGLYALFFPRRIVFAYMAAWGLFTATLRPLTGESVFELIERSYNFGMPLAFLVLHGLGSGFTSWVERVHPPEEALTDRRQRALQALFRVIVVMFLLGHGGYGLVGKLGLRTQYAHLGWTGLGPEALLSSIGAFELGLAAWACLSGSMAFFGCVTLWKLASESLFIWSPGPHWEMLERGGAYLAPLALVLLYRANPLFAEPGVRVFPRSRGAGARSRPSAPGAPG